MQVAGKPITEGRVNLAIKLSLRKLALL